MRAVGETDVLNKHLLLEGVEVYYLVVVVLSGVVYVRFRFVFDYGI